MKSVFKKLGAASTRKKDPAPASPSGTSAPAQEEDPPAAPAPPASPPPPPQASASTKREIDAPYTEDEFRDFLIPFYAKHEPKKGREEIEAVVKKYSTNGLLWIQVGLLRKYGTVMEIPGYEAHVREEKLPAKVAQEAAQFLSANGPGVPFDVSSVWVSSSSLPVAEDAVPRNVMGMAAPESMYAAKTSGAHGYKDAATILKSRNLAKYIPALAAKGIVAYNDLATLEDDDPFWLTVVPPFPDKKILKNIVADARNAVAAESGEEVAPSAAEETSEETTTPAEAVEAPMPPVPVFGAQPPAPPANLGNVAPKIQPPPPPAKIQPPPPPPAAAKIQPPPPPAKTVPPPPPKPTAAAAAAAPPPARAKPVVVPPPPPKPATSSAPAPPPPSTSSIDNKPSPASDSSVALAASRVEELTSTLQTKTREAEAAIEEAERLAEAATLLADRLNAELREHEQRLRTAQEALARAEQEEADAARQQRVPESPNEPPPEEEPETPRESPPAIPEDDEEEVASEKAPVADAHEETKPAAVEKTEEEEEAAPAPEAEEAIETPRAAPPATPFDEEDAEEAHEDLAEAEEPEVAAPAPAPPTTTSILINELRQHASPPKSAMPQHGGPQATPCENFVIDLTASTFSTCYCGHPKVAHGKSPQLGNLNSQLAASSAPNGAADANPFKNLPRTGSKRGSDLAPTPRTSGLGVAESAAAPQAAAPPPPKPLAPIVESAAGMELHTGEDEGTPAASPEASPMPVPDTPSQLEPAGSITRASAKARLEAFYAAEQPDKVSKVDEILDKYDGRYEKMFSSLAKKYPGKFV